MYTNICELIQCSIWGKKTEEWNLNTEEWDKLLLIARKQAVHGLVIDGMCMLDKEKRPERKKKLECAAMLHVMEQMNTKLNDLIKQIFQENGGKCPSMVLMKGQSIATRYPNPLHRACGDIDVYCHRKEDMTVIDKWAEKKASYIDTFYEAHHNVYHIDGVIIENHAILSELRSHKLRNALQQIINDEFMRNANSLPKCAIDSHLIPELPTNLYAIFLLIHMAEHLIEDGLGLRQVVDWCVFLDKEGDKIDRDLFWHHVQALQLERLAHTFGQIIVDDLGLDEAKLPFAIQRNERRKQILVKSIMEGGNFGHALYPWKGKVNKVQDMWLTMQVKVPRYAHMYIFWPKEAKACYAAMLIRGLRRIKQIMQNK